MIHSRGPTSLRNVLQVSFDIIGHRNAVLVPKCSRHLTRSFSSQQRTERKVPPQPKARLHEKIRDSILVLEAQQGPVGKTFVGIGQGLCAGGLVFGVGTFLYHVLSDRGQSILISYEEKDLTSAAPPTFTAPGARNVPEYVRDRLYTTYAYMAGSFGVSTLGAVASFRLLSSLAFLTLISANPLRTMGMAMGSHILLSMLVSALPYHEGFGVKQVGCAAHSFLMGMAAAPMYFFGAQSLIRATFVTAGVIGGLTGISTMVPQDTFVNWSIPLRTGMYGIFLACMAIWFLPKNHASYNLLYKVFMNGGLVVYPAYYLHNSKNVVREATYSPYFDPINESMTLYNNVFNIYARLAFLLPPHYFISGPTGKIPWSPEPK